MGDDDVGFPFFMFVQKGCNGPESIHIDAGVDFVIDLYFFAKNRTL